MKALRLLLVDPPFYRLYKDSYGLCKLPLGIGSLGANIEASGLADVRVLNADFHPAPEPFSIPFLAGEGFAAYRQALATECTRPFEIVRHAYESFKPHVIGISMRTPALASARITARLIKSLDPETIIIAGGPHPSVSGNCLRDLPEFDAAVLGEGEAALGECLHRLSRGHSLSGLPGVVVRGEAFPPQPRSTIVNLDALVYPARLSPKALIQGKDYPPKAFGYVFASRGCPRSCAYCSSSGVWGKRTRLRSAASIVNELELLKTLGVNHVHFDDDTFGLNHTTLLGLCRALESSGLGLSYSCETHVSLVDAQSAEALARAGFNRVQLGIESGDEAMLARVGKGFTVAEAEKAAALIKAAGMQLEAFFMVGFPEESETSLAATHSLMRRLPCDKIIYSIFTPYPGTQLYEYCQSRNLIPDIYDPSLHNHQSPENAFCPQIGKQRFRQLAAAIESFAAQKNASVI